MMTAEMASAFHAAVVSSKEISSCTYERKDGSTFNVRYALYNPDTKRGKQFAKVIKKDGGNWLSYDSDELGYIWVFKKTDLVEMMKHLFAAAVGCNGGVVDDKMLGRMIGMAVMPHREAWAGETLIE
jgi:hypothetical protein